MKLAGFAFGILFLLTFLTSSGQLIKPKAERVPADSTEDSNHPFSDKQSRSFGLGMGLCYGGFGTRLSLNMEDKLSFFTGLGWNIKGVGFNAGLQYDFVTMRNASFYISGMGGYNAVIYIKDVPTYQESFYGASFGLGLKFGSPFFKGNYWQVGLIAPIRGQAYREMLREVRDDSYVTLESEPPPVLITIGYNFGF